MRAWHSNRNDISTMLHQKSAIDSKETVVLRVVCVSCVHVECKDSDFSIHAVVFLFVTHNCNCSICLVCSIFDCLMQQPNETKSHSSKIKSIFEAGSDQPEENEHQLYADFGAATKHVASQNGEKSDIEKLNIASQYLREIRIAN